MSVNATLNADISIKNPNIASFSYDRSETEFYYREETVGVAYAPDGEVIADWTTRMNVTPDALIVSCILFVRDSKASGDFSEVEEDKVRVQIALRLCE